MVVSINDTEEFYSQVMTTYKVRTMSIVDRSCVAVLSVPQVASIVMRCCYTCFLFIVTLVSSSPRDCPTVRERDFLQIDVMSLVLSVSVCYLQVQSHMGVSTILGVSVLTALSGCLLKLNKV